MPVTTLPLDMADNSRWRATDLLPIRSKKERLPSRPATRRSSRIASRQLKHPPPTGTPLASCISLPLPIGLRWSNNSCAYDATFTILHLIWSESSHTYTDYKLLQSIIQDANTAHHATLTLEAACDNFRCILAVEQPSAFPFGAYCAVIEVLQFTLSLKKPFMTTSLLCEQGHHAQRQPYNLNDCVITGHCTTPQTSTNLWLSLNPPAPWVYTCASCSGVLIKAFKINFASPIIAISCGGNPNLVIDPSVELPHLPVHDQRVPSTYDLKGVIYWWANIAHFTCRVITKENIVYWHDGMSNSVPIRESAEHTISISVSVTVLLLLLPCILNMLVPIYTNYPFRTRSCHA